MPTAVSLASEVCNDVPRWYSAAVVLSEANTPLSLGYSCVTDLCIQRLFEEEYSLLVLGTDYTADLDAGTVTLLAELEGTAIAYFNVIVCATAEECKTAPCCPPDPYEYQSINGTDSGTETNEGCEEVVVTVDPISGAVVFFPTYVVLSADHDGAVIQYTTDGSDPDEFSDIYTGPFEVTQAGTIVKARATVGTCSAGPITTILFQNPPFEIGMVYNCDTPDHGGTWDVWVPNGTVDNHFQIEFTLPAITTIKRLEVYQLDAAGNWTTGIVWSTDSPINGSFDAMPLLLFIAAVQQHTDYQASLGAFAAATHNWDLYGDRQFPVSGFFRLEMVLDDDSRLVTIADTTCTVDPPTPCPSPAAPTATAECDGNVTVSFPNTIGQNFKLYYAPQVGPEVLFESGTTTDNPMERTVTGLTPGQSYFFRVELEYAGCGFQSSIAVTAVPLPDPEVSIYSDKLVVDPNETFTIEWESTYIGGAVCGGCLDGQVSINQSMGCKAGNAPGSQSQSKASPGLYTYTITGCNTCGTVVNSVQVEVRDVAVCSTQPTILNVDVDPTTFLCPLTSCAVGYSVEVPWNGQIPKTSDCLWSSNVSAGCEAAAFPGSGAYAAMAVSCGFSGGVFFLQFVATTVAATLIWRGEKAFGISPLGTYTRTGGCATGPSTITIS